MIRGGAVTELLQRMGGHADQRRPARRCSPSALGDRSLRVLYWLDDKEALGRRARPARPRCPADDDPARAWTLGRPRGPARRRDRPRPRRSATTPSWSRSVAAAAGLAIENERLEAQLRARVEELRASRARIVEAGTAERRRLERNLHDGAQQRLVALSLTMRVAQDKLRDRPRHGRASCSPAPRRSSQLALEELRELARGIHPAMLSDRGLARGARGARRPLAGARRAGRHARASGCPPAVEAAAYFVVAEALTNVVKYAHAIAGPRSRVERANGHAVVEVADDGVGGADPARGSGLRGLADRVAALDGRLSLRSPQGAGTLLRAEIPV